MYLTCFVKFFLEETDNCKYRVGHVRFSSLYMITLFKKYLHVCNYRNKPKFILFKINKIKIIIKKIVTISSPN